METDGTKNNIEQKLQNNIDKCIDDENAFWSKNNEIIKSQNALEKEIVETVINKHLLNFIENREKPRHDVNQTLHGLLKLINELNLDNKFAHKIFTSLLSWVEYEVSKKPFPQTFEDALRGNIAKEEIDIDLIKLDLIKGEIENSAKGFFMERFIEELNKKAESDQLIYLNRIIDTHNRDRYPFIHEVALDFKASIENPTKGLNGIVEPNIEVDEQQKEEEAGSEKDLSARRLTILILTLMYGTPSVPDQINKTEVGKLIKSFKTVDLSNIYDFVRDPIGAKPESIKQRQSRIKDLKAVKTIYKSLQIHSGRWGGIDKAIENLESQIKEIQLWKQEDNEEKQNNY